MTTTFQPDYHHFEAVMRNRRPARLPLYEHLVNPGIMGRLLGVDLEALLAGAAAGNAGDQAEAMRQHCRFFQQHTYDTVSYEVCVTEILPEHGALSGGGPAPSSRVPTWRAIPGPSCPRAGNGSRSPGWTRWWPRCRPAWRRWAAWATACSRSPRTWWAWNTCPLCRPTIRSCTPSYSRASAT